MLPHPLLNDAFVPSATKAPGRHVWHTAFRTGAPATGLVFLDGELYLERVAAMSVLNDLEDRKDTPPLRAIFVSNQSPADRHADFTCDDDYAAFLATDARSWLLDRYPEIDPGGIVLVGLSLSGLAAAHAALTHPEAFGAAICQSPSFWWEDERFRRALPTDGAQRPALWVSVGSAEVTADVSHPPSGLYQGVSQIDACERAVTALRGSGCLLRYEVFKGGHDPECWREELASALSWAIGTSACA